MKILFICNKHRSRVCGVGDYTYYLNQELIKHGYETQVIDMGSATFANIKKIKPSLINIQYTPTMYEKTGISAVVLAAWAKASKIRCITTIHERYHPLKLNPKVIVLSALQRISFILMLLVSESVIFCVQSWLEAYRKCFFLRSQKAYFLPVGSNIPYLPLTDKEKSDMRRKIGAGDNTIILGTFGKTGYSTNKFYFDTLLTAFETLNQRGRDTILLLAGWPKKKDLYNLYKGRIKCDSVVPTGELSAGEISKLLNIIDVYLAPLDDGISARKGSIMAAMQHGLPVISTFTVQTDDIFKSCRAAMLTKPNKQAFINALIDMVDDKQKKLAMGSAGKSFYAKNFSWGVIADEFIKIIYDSSNKVQIK